MGAQTVIRRALVQEYEVRGDHAQVDMIPAWRALGEDLSDSPNPWWGVEVWAVKAWIRQALVAGDYATASVYSALIRTRRVVPTRGVTLTKATDRPLPAGVVMFVSEWELDRIRYHRLVDELPGHDEGLCMNDPITLASFFEIACR